MQRIKYKAGSLTQTEEMGDVAMAGQEIGDAIPVRREEDVSDHINTDSD